jgi:predicted HNH restriction endonuclease
MTKQDAITKLQSLQKHSECSNVHASADTVLCDFLDAVGYGEIAREFRKVHEIYPIVTPRYSKPSWRL